MDDKNNLDFPNSNSSSLGGQQSLGRFNETTPYRMQVMLLLVRLVAHKLVLQQFAVVTYLIIIRPSFKMPLLLVM